MNKHFLPFAAVFGLVVVFALFFVPWAPVNSLGDSSFTGSLLDLLRGDKEKVVQLALPSSREAPVSGLGRI